MVVLRCGLQADVSFCHVSFARIITPSSILKADKQWLSEWVSECVAVEIQLTMTGRDSDGQWQSAALALHESRALNYVL